MKQYIITWDLGYGESAELIEADSYDKALEIAYLQWKDEAESQADYGVLEATEENKEDYGL